MPFCNEEEEARSPSVCPQVNPLVQRPMSCSVPYHPPPHVNGPGHVSSFDGGGPLTRGAMLLLSGGGVHWLSSKV